MQRYATAADPSKILGEHEDQIRRFNELALPASTQLTRAQQQKTKLKGLPGYKIPNYTGFVPASREHYGSTYGRMTSELAQRSPTR